MQTPFAAKIEFPVTPPVPVFDAAEKSAYKERIKALLKQQDAVLVAHYYTDELLQALAEETGNRPVGILATNSLEMALVDLACLTSGVVNIMVPATSSETDVEFILEHAGVGALVVSDAEQLQKVQRWMQPRPVVMPAPSLPSRIPSA